MYLCQAQQIIEISDSNVITHEHALLSIESACPRRPLVKTGRSSRDPTQTSLTFSALMHYYHAVYYFALFYKLNAFNQKK